MPAGNVTFANFARIFDAYSDGFIDHLDAFRRGLQPLLSDEIDRLETDLAKSSGVERAVSVSSGTSAIALALQALSLPEGSFVLCPTYTFVGTANAISAAKLYPFLVDVDGIGPNIGAVSIREAFDRATLMGLTVSALITVDIFGIPVDYAAVETLVSELGIVWICDNAQSFGSNLNGRSVMSFGDAATTSFYPTKVLGGISEGGCIFTNSPRLATTVEALANQGFARHQGKFLQHGTNARMSTISALFLQQRLSMFERDLKRRVEISQHYENASGRLAMSAGCAGWNGYIHTVLTKDMGRSIHHYNENNIEVRRYYSHPLHILHNQHNRITRTFPNAERLASQSLSVPLHAFLSDEEVERVAAALRTDPGSRR